MCCGLFWPYTAYGMSDYNQQITDVQSQIEVLISLIPQTENNRAQLQEQLTTITNELASISEKMNSTQTKIRYYQLQSAESAKQKNKLVLDLERQSADLKSIIRGSIVISRINFLKVMFSQEDSSKLVRAVTYYRYLTQARADQTRKIYQSMQELQTIESNIQQGKNSVQTLQEQKLKIQQRLGQIEQQLTAMIEANRAAVDKQ